MSLKEAFERYDKEMVEEVVNIIAIDGYNRERDWREFALRHKLIRPTTKVVKLRGNADKVDRKYVPGSGFVRLDDPYTKYRVNLVNGNSQSIIYMIFTSLELEQWRKGEV